MLTLALFGAGHVLVAVIATLFIRLLNRQPDLLPRRERIFELNSRPMRIEAGEAELAASNAEVAVIDKRIERTDAKLADALPLDDPPSTMAAYGLIACILAEAEAGLVWLLSGPVKFLSLSSDAWGFAAPAFASAWIVLIHVLLGWAVEDKYRPARTLRRAKVGAGLCGCAVIVGGWLTLSGRNLTDTNVIEQMAGAGLMILAGLVSICAAFCSLVATTLLEARHHERERARLTALRDQYTRHIEAIQKDLARLQKLPDPPENPPTAAAATPEPVKTPPTAGSAVPAGIIPTVFMLACLIGAPAFMMAQSVNPGPAVVTVAAEAPSRASAPDFVRDGGCEYMPDITTSVDRATFKTTISQAAEMMPMVIERLHCRVVRVSPFAGDLFVSIDEIVIPAVEDPATRCQSAPPAAESARAKAVGLLYPSVASAHQQQAADACATQGQHFREEGLAKRRAAITAAQDNLRAVSALQPRGPCTALFQSVQRALRRSQHLITITDGVPTCTAPTKGVAVPANGSLLFLLVPSGDQNADRANVLLDRMDALERSFQGARAVLAPEVTVTFWQGTGR